MDYWKITGGTRIQDDHHMFELIEFIDRFLPLCQWNFRMSAHYIYYANQWSSALTAQNYSGPGYPIVFYNSEKCWIKVESLWNPREYERSINVKYGSLAVSDTAKTALLSADPESYPVYRHSVHLPLYFLDGLSPEEARNAKQPQLMKELKQSDLGSNIRSEPEKDLFLQATAWERYEQRFFDIFDLHNEDLRERYCTFVSEYWKTWLRI